MKFRLTYPVSLPFSRGWTIALCLFYIFAFAGLLIWNFLTSAKALQCLKYASSTYSSDSCDATPLEFSRSYYTQPLASSTSIQGTIGTFPWSPLAFGNGTSGPIDYSILTLNWTANPLQCVMYDQNLLLDLNNEGSVITSCYYCGSDLRVICTSVDSVRSQIPDTSAVSYAATILPSFGQLSLYAHQVATTAVSGATVASVRIRTHRAVTQVAPGVLPNSQNLFEVSLGTTLGPVPIYSNSSRSGVAQVATYAAQLCESATAPMSTKVEQFKSASMIEEATERDLQPGNSGPLRTLQVSYLCKRCTKQYKPVLEIVALLITGVFGVLGTAFTVAKLIAEWSSDTPASPFTCSNHPNTQLVPQASPDPYKLNSTSYTASSQPVFSGHTLPYSQAQAYQSVYAGNQWPGAGAQP